MFSSRAFGGRDAGVDAIKYGCAWHTLTGVEPIERGIDFCAPFGGQG